MTPAMILLALVTLGRIGELVVARRNTARLLAAGATEVAPGHYPVIVAMHGLWLASLWIFGSTHAVQPVWLGVFLLLQGARAWVLLTLGARWTTRIITVPGEALVTHGPFRLLSHPNYAVVIAELAMLPMCLDLPWVALIFTIANALVLTVRIRAETAGLTEARSHGVA